MLGYLRRGARFRASEEAGREGCARGWFEALGGGFVCHGEGVLVDSDPPRGQDGPVLPALSDALPYRYAKIAAQDVPQFSRLPTVEEEAAIKAAFARTPRDGCGSECGRRSAAAAGRAGARTHAARLLRQRGP